MVWRVRCIKQKSPSNERLFCGATENLACIILISASKLRFNGSYSDELRSPHKLKFAGTPY